MSRAIRFFLLSLGLLFWLSGTLFAQYIIVLKNGHRMTVQSYREEGGMVKFYGLGGEIGIARDQIQSILESGATEGQGMVFPGAKKAPAKPAAAGKTSKVREKVATPAPGGKPKTEGKKEATAGTDEKALTPEEKLAEERDKEEKEYQKRVGEITGRIKALRDRYALATKGSTSSNPTLLNNKEAINARTADLNSRLRDAQHNPGGPSDSGGVSLSRSSSFAGASSKTTELRHGGVIPRARVPLPNYSAKERELSELRKQISQLEKQRESLIEEMKQKNFDTGSLFLE